MRRTKQEEALMEFQASPLTDELITQPPLESVENSLAIKPNDLEKAVNSQAVRKPRRIGFSRPGMEIVDLPTPEEAFKVNHVGLEEMILFVLGPGLIALAVSFGRGAWLSAPLIAAQGGLTGRGWIILVSAILQVFYIVELARFTIATGETPIVAFGRIPPGFLFWVPLALLCLFTSFILGGWTVNAGEYLFALFTGHQSTPVDAEVIRVLVIGLLLSTFLFVGFGRKIERSLEATQSILIVFALISLVMVSLVIVPAGYWMKSLVSWLAPVLPSKSTDLSLLGTLAGITALASGLNFMIVGYYRDKGYGMGHQAGFISSFLSRQQKGLLPSGKVFPENERNSATWKRWFRYLIVDQWVVYFGGMMIAMFVPSILISYLASLPGVTQPDKNSILLFAATQLGKAYGPVLFGWALIIGFIILYSTQIIVLELLARNMADAIYSLSFPIRRSIQQDPRRLYYPTMFILVILIGVVIHLNIPSQLMQIAANIANFAGLIFPLAMVYLNSQLPKPARISWWSTIVLIANALFFGFFFLNFLSIQTIGRPLLMF